MKSTSPPPPPYEYKTERRVLGSETSLTRAVILSLLTRERCVAEDDTPPDFFFCFDVLEYQGFEIVDVTFIVKHNESVPKTESSTFRVSDVSRKSKPTIKFGRGCVIARHPRVRAVSLSRIRRSA